MDIKTLSTIIGHVSSATTLNTYTHVTDAMRQSAADKIDRGIGRAEPKPRREVAPQKPPPSTFQARKGQRRKPGTGCVTQINDHLWEGRYSPIVNGQRMARNVYAKTEAECEKKLAELIREKALHCLQEEIPHGIAVAIDRMKMQNKVMHIDATIICERDSHKGIIIGKQGSMLKKIGSTARYEIERMLDCKVNLKLWVKVQKNWRDSDFLMKNFGYHEDEM